MLHVNHTSVDRVALCERLFELWEQTGSPALEALARGRSPCPGASVDTAQQFIDWVSTSLMDCYKDSGDSAVFALLFELNRASFLHAIQCNLRRSYHHVDPQDVLQEVFLNIYRYPHRFLADKADAFRGWGHRIARNTLLKFLKGQARLSRFQTIDEETMQPEDLHTRRPDRAASDRESASVVNRAYLMYLQLYMLHFARLSTKERRALTMVEVDGHSYRDAAADLGIRLENLKMVIFRGRRKIFRGMERSLAELAAKSEPVAGALPAKGELGQNAAAAVSRGKSMRRSASDRRVLARNCNSAKLMCDQPTQGI
ncbi:MAG: RNA polymerase sigma factor (sigma-70 family) [Planctomycetota bacterium]|jgi:RNA polymerase sigma factor (sigma-70 family)